MFFLNNSFNFLVFICSKILIFQNLLDPPRLLFSFVEEVALIWSSDTGSGNGPRVSGEISLKKWNNSYKKN